MAYSGWKRVLLGGVALVTASVGGFGAVHAQTLTVELNKLEPRQMDCRAYLVLENGTPDRFSSLKLDLFLFDPEGIVDRRVALQAAPIEGGKTTVKVFDLKDRSCGGIGRMLLNDVSECRTGGDLRTDCLAQIVARSRTSTPFLK